MKKLFFVPLFAVLFSTQFIYSGQVVNGWTITTDNSGNVQTMSFDNPKTELNTEAHIELTIDYQGVPVKGTVKFRDGVVRDINLPAEAMTYWDNLLGPSTFWDYMLSQKKITSIDPQKGVLPPTCFGRMSRVISKEGKEYIGKLTDMPANPDWFHVVIEGSTVTMYRLAIREIQQF